VSHVKELPVSEETVLQELSTRGDCHAGAPGGGAARDGDGVAGEGIERSMTSTDS
jgi:hypothetical protein